MENPNINVNEELMDMFLANKCDFMDETDSSSKKAILAHNRAMQLAKVIKENEDNELKRLYQQERDKAIDKQKKLDSALKAGEIAAGAGVGIYTTVKSASMLKTCLKFEDTNFMVRDSTKTAFKNFFTKVPDILKKIVR